MFRRALLASTFLMGLPAAAGAGSYGTPQHDQVTMTPPGVAGTPNALGQWNFLNSPIVPGLPGLTKLIYVNGTPVAPGLDLRACTSNPTCQLYFTSAPTTLAQGAAAVRIDRSASYTNDVAIVGGVLTGAVATLNYTAPWATINVNDVVWVQGSNVAALNGSHTVTAVGASSISFASTATGSVSAAGTFYDISRIGTWQAMWVLSSTSPNGAMYEWPITSQMYNQTGASLGHGAQNVAINGTAIKQFKAGYAYGTDQIGPTWAANFACADNTGTVAPIASCIGVEIDNSFKNGVGLDTNRQRVGIQLAWSTEGGGPNYGDHIAFGILGGGDISTTMDTFIYPTGAGRYGTILDTTAANIAPGGYVIKATNWTLNGVGDVIQYGSLTVGNTGTAALGVAGNSMFYGGASVWGGAGAAPGAGEFVVQKSVGIGTAAPVVNTGYGGLTLDGTVGGLITMRANGSAQTSLQTIADTATYLTQNATTIPFIVNFGSTEVARLTSSLISLEEAVALTALPTTAGGGGLYVCVDTAGNLYKKASCP